MPDLTVYYRSAHLCAEALLLLLAGDRDGNDVAAGSLGEGGCDLGVRQRVASQLNLCLVKLVGLGDGGGDSCSEVVRVE